MQYVFVTQPLLERASRSDRSAGCVCSSWAQSMAGSCIGMIYPLLLWYFMSRPHVVDAFNGLVVPVDVAKGYVPSVQDTWAPVDASNPYAASGMAGAAPPAMGGPQYSATESIVETFVPSRNGAALVAYYCGIFSLFPCLGFPLGVVAVYYGFKGLRAERENPAVRGGVHAWVGVICGILFGFFNFLLCVAAVIGIGAAILKVSDRLLSLLRRLAGELVFLDPDQNPRLRPAIGTERKRLEPRPQSDWPGPLRSRRRRFARPLVASPDRCCRVAAWPRRWSDRPRHLSADRSCPARVGTGWWLV